MPGYRAHLVVGFLTYLPVAYWLTPYQSSPFIMMLGLLFCLMGSLFPDIDIKSKGQKLFYTLIFLLLLFLLYFKMYCVFIIVALLGGIPLLVGHRTIFHHIWFLI